MTRCAMFRLPAVLAMSATLLVVAAGCSATGGEVGENSGPPGAGPGIGGGGGAGGGAGGAGNSGGGVGGSAMGGGGSGGGTAGTGGGFINTDGGSDAKLPDACQFVDILFMIDGSPSMSDYQKKLASIWPQFVDAMYTSLPPNIDLHVGITHCSFDTTGVTAEGPSNCVSDQPDDYLKSKFTEPGTKSSAENGAQGRLFKYDNKYFFAGNTSLDSQPLKTWFDGAAKAVGEFHGAVELHSAGAAYVADPANAATNAGFIRDQGAVMLIVFLADEPDKSYAVATSKQLHDKFMAAKRNCGDKCVLTAGIFDPCNVNGPKPILWEFMTSFGNANPSWVPIDGAATEYAKVVGQELATVIGKSCVEIGPPK